MVFLFILVPVILVSGIAIYLERKSGMTPPDLTEHATKIGEAYKISDINKYSSGS
ncbi:hypothetical protein LCL96_15760 [Rossellomorea aquimaris]|uniref:hypothetical protein n=1 Tax=Rossellomorea TaxID=2837508 RepID=UPI001CD1E157|nr:hypothetical protein [Rossellomorea aquimaris]MCA1060393.1 hypothetical protein [Rossellomorea aquimaris]